MLKKWMLGMILLSTSLFSQATLITSSVDAIDMQGITVTAFFADNTQETQIWSALSATVGGVINSDWSLTLDGNTFGDYDSVTNTFYGLWTLSNLNAAEGIVGLTVNAGIVGYYFDILNGYASSTPGSDAGREFVASDATVNASFSDLFSAPDLYGKLTINWASNTQLIAGQELTFLTDTDKAVVPEPSTIVIFALSLFVLISLRKKSSGSI